MKMYISYLAFILARGFGNEKYQYSIAAIRKINTKKGE